MRIGLGKDHHGGPHCRMSFSGNFDADPGGPTAGRVSERLPCILTAWSRRIGLPDRSFHGPAGLGAVPYGEGQYVTRTEIRMAEDG